MTQKPRRGRPPVGSDTAKSKSLLIRMSPSEKLAFEAAAELAGAPLAVWMRERLRTASRRELTEAGQQVPFIQANAGE